MPSPNPHTIEPQCCYPSLNMQDHEGLEVVLQHSNPEVYKPRERSSSISKPQVVENQSPSLVAHDGPEVLKPLERSASVTRPEAVEFSSPPFALDPQAPPYSEKITAQSHYAAVDSDESKAPSGEETTPVRKTYCGLRRRTFILIVVAVIVLLIVAVGTGVGVSVSNKSKSQSDTQGSNSNPTPSSTPSATPNSNTSSVASSFTARSKSGLAVLKSGDSNSNAFAYYQDTNGTIRELSWRNSAWTAEAAGMGTVTTNAMDSTPIAAATYVTSNGGPVVSLVAPLFHTFAAPVLISPSPETGVLCQQIRPARDGQSHDH